MMITQKHRDIRDREINPDQLNKLLLEWVSNRSNMESLGQESPDQWEGVLPEIGDYVLVKMGSNAPGLVVNYSMKLSDTDNRYKRSVIVKLNDSSLIDVTSSECESIDKKEARNIMSEMSERDTILKNKLLGAVKKMEKKKREKRKKTIIGSHLLNDMLKLASSHEGITVSEKTSFYKISFNNKKKNVYLSRKGGRVDLSGFCVDHDLITKISEKEAKERHIGNVRGQMNFSADDKEVMSVWKFIIEELKK